MGKQRIRVRDFTVRCCQGTFCAIGFITTALFLMALVWIAWCYFGLAMVQVSTGQRRALVNYSLVKPTQTTPSVQPSLDESSSNTISKLAPTSPSSSFHKPRDLSTVPPLLIPDPNSNKTQNVTKVEIQEDGLQTRKVAPSKDNRYESAEPIENPELVNKNNSSKTPFDPLLKSDTVPKENVSRDEVRASSREKPKEGGSTAVRDEIQDSRTSVVHSASRVPDFARDPPRSSMRESTRYDEDEYRGSRSRIDTRDLVPYADDEYSKGDSRSYAEDDIGRRRSDNRRREERYGDYHSDDVPRRREDDDDRYRYHDENSRHRSRDTRYDDRDGYRSRDYDRYRSRNDDKRYRWRSDEDVSREDDKYRSRYDDRDRSRIDGRDIKIDGRDTPRRFDDIDIPYLTDDRYRHRNDDRDKPNTDDRDRSRMDDSDRRLFNDRSRTRVDDRDDSLKKIDDRHRTGVDEFNHRLVDDKSDVGYADREKVRAEDRYRLQDDERDRARGHRNRDSYKGVLESEDEYRSRIDSRRRTSEDEFIEEKTKYSDRDRYRPRVKVDPYDDDTRTIRRDYEERIITRTDSLSPLPISKGLSDRAKVDETDYPRRSGEIPSSVLSETRSRDRDENYRRPSRYDDRDRIYPTRVREDAYMTTLGSHSERSPPPLTGSRSRDHYHEDTARIRDTKHNGEEDKRRSYSSSAGSSGREYKTRLPVERDEGRYIDRGDEVSFDRRSYTSDEEDDYREKSHSRTSSEGRHDSKLRGDDDPYEHLSSTDERDEYPRRRKDDDDEEYRRERPRSGYDAPRSRLRDSYDDYSRDDDRYDEDRPIRRYDDRPIRRYDDSPRYRDDTGVSKEDRPYRNIDERPADPMYDPSSIIDETRLEAPRPRAPSDTKLQDGKDRSHSVGTRTPESPRVSLDSDRRDHAHPVERPLNAKDVIEAALRHSDMSDALRKVSYPVFDPRVSNLTSPDVIRASERRGTTILSRRKRRLGV
ncbi:hypothetical protein JTE90_008805 [Oedothorax gibbosus]|uniref:Uncharacterized protein n=1 Tax=Oedothorax gibbosus TaxID=931172 RepID=A0AAV6V553_9ARAC|nr:hypothetical protein JTE90_008805 [Oedothorax gibbosus]